MTLEKAGEVRVYVPGERVCVLDMLSHSALTTA